MSKHLKRALFACLLCFAWVPVHALTLAQIKTEVRRALRDNPSDTARQRYSDAVLLDFINQAQREVVNVSWLAEKTTSYVLSAGASYYQLPEEFLAVSQVYFRNTQNQTFELEELSQKALYDQMPDWDRQQGEPVQYWVSQATATSTLNPTTMRISYIPIPTRTSTGTVTLWFLHQTADLSSDTDIPFEARRHLYPYHLTLVYHVVMRIKIIEGKIDEATTYQTLYANEIGIMKDRLGRAPNYTPGMIGGSRK